MSDSKKRGLARVWSEFVAEARTLSTRRPEDMAPDQLDRLDAVSDPLIHLAGRSASHERSSGHETDRLLQGELARQRELRGRRAMAEPSRTLDSADRNMLRQRILSGLQAGRLRVREADAAPSWRSIGASRPLTPALLQDAELAHRALVVPELAVAAGAGRELWDVECDSAVDLPEDLARGAYVVLQVSGDSMEPLMHSGDMVLVRVGASAMRGTVVVARDPDHGYVVKEVGRVTAAGIELLSLNPRYAPFSVPHGDGAVLGTVVLRWRQHGAPA